MPNQLPLPLDADVSPLLSPARDQGPRGTCTAFAITALHEARRIRDVADRTELSEEVLYWGAKQVDKNGNPGTSFRSAHLALGKWGQPAAGFWPYDPGRNDHDASYVPPPEALSADNCHYGVLEAVLLDVTAVKAHLAAGRAVAASVAMSTGFFTAPNGVVPLPAPHEMLAENHAVLLTGYSKAGAFLFRNSWGTAWGAYGYGTLPYDYILRHGKSAYVLRLKT